MQKKYKIFLKCNLVVQNHNINHKWILILKVQIFFNKHKKLIKINRIFKKEKLK